MTFCLQLIIIDISIDFLSTSLLSVIASIGEYGAIVVRHLPNERWMIVPESVSDMLAAPIEHVLPIPSVIDPARVDAFITVNEEEDLIHDDIF